MTSKRRIRATIAFRKIGKEDFISPGFYFLWDYSPLTPQKYMELTMSGNTGERPFADIMLSIQYWVIHNITMDSLRDPMKQMKGQRHVKQTSNNLKLKLD
jgi:hypothetical protein